MPAMIKHVAASPAAPARAKLLEAGLRPTRQRVDLAKILFNGEDRHFTAEMIHTESRTVRHPPSLATVYNTLHLFAEHGLLREIAIYGAKAWYDTKTGPHFHFYRGDREELFDIPDAMVPLLNIAAPEGTVIEAIDIVVRLKGV